MAEILRLPAITALVFLLAMLGGCEPYPKDAEETTRMVLESGRVRVGVIHNPPWTDTRGPVPEGREVELVENFARALGVAPVWRTYGTHAAFAALEHGEIDLLIGGLVQSTPYAKKAGMTRPYERTRGEAADGPLKHVLAVRRGENRFLITLERFLKEEVAGGGPGGELR